MSPDAELLVAIERAARPTCTEITESKHLILDALAVGAVETTTLQDLPIVHARLPLQLDERHAIDVLRWNGRDIELTALRHTRLWRAGNRAVIDLLGHGIIVRRPDRRWGDAKPAPGRQSDIDIPIIGAESRIATIVAPVAAMTGTCSLSPRYAAASTPAWLADPAMFGEHLGIIAADTPLRSAIDRTLGAYRAEASCFTRSVHDMVDVGWAAARRALDIANERWPSRTTSRETVLWTLRRSSHLGGTGNQLGGQDRSLCARLDAMDADPSLSHIPVGRRPQMSTTMLLSDAHRLLEALASAVTTVTGHDLSAA